MSDAKRDMRDETQNEGAAEQEICKICGHKRISHSSIGICFEPTCGCTDFNDQHGRITDNKRPIRWGIGEWLLLIALFILIVFFVLSRI